MPMRFSMISAILFFGVLALFTLSYRTYFYGGQSFEFCHYAEIASNILQGRGFSTASYDPAGLAFLDHVGAAMGQTGPLAWRYILFAYWSSFWMSVAGRGDFGMALGNGIAHALWVVFVYWMGCSLFNKRTALLSACLWGLSPLMLLGFDLSGHPDVLFGLLFGLLNIFFWRVLKAQRQPSVEICAGIGIFAGLAYLSRYSFIIWLPLYLLLPFVLRRPWALRMSILFLCGFLVGWADLAFYCFRHFHTLSNPFSTWHFASYTVGQGMPWSEYKVFTGLDFMSLGVAVNMIRKWFILLRDFLNGLPTLWRLPLLIPVAVMGMATAPSPAAGFAAWLAVLFGWQVTIFSFMRQEDLGFLNGRYYLWLAPFIILYAVAFLEKHWSSKAWKIGGSALLVLHIFYWSMNYAAIPKATGEQPIPDWPEISYIREKTPPNARIATNIPTQVTWYAKRRTVNLTNNPQDLAALEARWPVDYLFVSNHQIGELYNFPHWQALLSGRLGEPPEKILAAMGFQYERAFQNGVLFRKIKISG